MEMCDFSELIGVKLTAITGCSVGSDTIEFTADDGRKWSMFHAQDCCESVKVDDVVGDVMDLLDSPIVLAEASSNAASIDDFRGQDARYFESGTWTFYRIATQRGHVDIKWLGESNGYYSESVDFYKEPTP